MPENTSNLTFDDALQQLEGIVQQLESGKLPLEESMKAFERGVQLGKLCNEKLTNAEKKIELLTRQSDEEVSTQEIPFPVNNPN
ncbi:MAG: exodeoxyribonuclease VII small subunit [Lentisphaeria bacterium]|nr:exodeoxyribonuclease VII small subunit [Lentisphaeria bacterium]